MDEASTIVVGYDGSDAARRALTRARGLGERASKVLVVAVAPDLRSVGLAPQSADGAFDTQRLLDEALGLLDPSEQMWVELLPAAGDPAVVLVDAAREVGADLLIVGRRGGDFVARTLLVRSPSGSFSRRIATCWSWDEIVASRSFGGGRRRAG